MTCFAEIDVWSGSGRPQGFWKTKIEVSGYKMALNRKRTGLRLIELIIPANTWVHGIPSSKNQNYFFDPFKMRAQRAIVAGIYDENGKARRVAYSDYALNFVYRVGEEVKPKNGFSFKLEPCESGIHFFASVKEAVYWGNSNILAGYRIGSLAGTYYSMKNFEARA